jgi:hypothetical protein
MMKKKRRKEKKEKASKKRKWRIMNKKGKECKNQ